ncbi:arginyl-tRNA synthetase [Pseudomonas nitritireducens]|uniref:Arginine--tRNA ligase n=1 Tax=Pseudomonas nitroreducens TaxID=46680 RepID=A0A7W7KRU1_PSENT|nr:arginine--tRNA ligase [Pseudomonas nitritireducens]MBB4867153.1 arginyl-tRNA synthetase [Pseudomonas nitritireducens]
MKAVIIGLVRSAIDTLRSNGTLPPSYFFNIQVESTKDKANGDFSCNIAMMMAKQAKMKPQELAKHFIEALPASDQISKVEMAGPGFINFTWNPQALNDTLTAALADPALGVRKESHAERVVVDLSSPNLAKQMHVGHLRSTIIGDSVARVLEFLGDTVIRQNHVGDWGTQFGMLLAYMQEQNTDSAKLADLEAFYKAAKKRFDSDESFAAKARDLVVQLQAGDPHCLDMWKRFNDISLAHCQALYDRLGVKLSSADVMGESAYNDDLQFVVSDLDANGLLSESDGAKCVFLEGYTSKTGEPLPLIVQKSGGGYLYASTDLAALRYRAQALEANRVLYFVDQRQDLHFSMVFECARAAEFVPPLISLEHMGFGTMNGADGRPIKTRDGESVKLADLLDEAELRAAEVVREKNPNLPPADLAHIAKVVGIGAVKYADLSKHRTSDYNFNLTQMLALDGNTAPYLLYAYTRVAGIFRKLGDGWEQTAGGISLATPEELALGRKLALFLETLNSVATKGMPHLLCAYLFDVAVLFSSFYENCPIITCSDEVVRASRIKLAALTGRTLKKGLELIGIETLEAM